MKPIKERNFVTYCILSVLTLGIYALVFWHRLAKDVNKLCEGDGKKTMKYVPSFFLSLITVGIFGFVWKYKLAERLRDNAERYGLCFSESGALVVVYSTVGMLLCLAGPVVGHYILVKNFNKMAKAYNDYNSLVDENAGEDIFAD